MARRRWVALVFLAAIGLIGCPDDPLFTLNSNDGGPDGNPMRLDTGIPGDAALPVSRRIVWVRVPSTSAQLEGDNHRLRVRLPPPTSHGSSSSPEHNVGSALSGGNR